VNLKLPGSCKRIIGLDLSLAGTGWCSGPASESWGTIDTKKLSGFDRINCIFCEVNKIIGSPPPPGVLVVMEDFSFGSKGRGVFQIGGLGYIIRYHLWKNQIPFILIPPTVLKKFAAGKGNVDKNVVLKEIFKRWGADINDDNAGDAYVLYQIGRSLAGLSQKLAEFQREILENLEKDPHLVTRKES
jgi:crossover junction endodeoxyribonuclease RuvC